MLSNSIGTYADVFSAFSTALERGAIELTFPTAAQAVRWRGRAYRYRQLLSLRLPTGITPFDSLTIQRTDDPRTIRISPFSANFQMKIDGNLVTPEEATPEDAALLPSAASPRAPAGVPSTRLSSAPTPPADLTEEDEEILAEVMRLMKASS